MKTIQISDETYEKIKDQIEAEKKPEFEPKTICCLVIDAKGSKVRINTLYDLRSHSTCVQSISEAKRTVAALQSAMAHVEANE